MGCRDKGTALETERCHADDGIDKGEVYGSLECTACKSSFIKSVIGVAVCPTGPTMAITPRKIGAKEIGHFDRVSIYQK